MKRRFPFIVIPLVVPLMAIGSGCVQDDPVEPVLTGPAARGRELVETRGCMSCHSTDGASGTGPTWKNLAGAEVPLSDGTSVLADDAYLRLSILSPDADTVAGFPTGVMAASVPNDSISPDEADAIVAYINTLATAGPEN